VALLEVRDLSKNFGGLAAITRLNFDVSDGEILGLIGPNGAGKTTLFNIITGFFPPDMGKILFEGKNITHLKPHKVAQRGIGRTFQLTTLCIRSSVFVNVFAGFHLNYKVNVWKAFLHFSSARKEEETMKERAMKILEFMGIASLKDELARNLPHGHQRILGVCIALATNPKLLFLDEPMTGMNPEETATLVSLVKKIRDDGVTIVVVEHDMKAIMKLCDRIMVMNFGEKIAEGLPNEIKENKDVIEAYLGREETLVDVA
jgi:branched-chain amino acid transport system ATP-binding protein